MATGIPTNSQHKGHSTIRLTGDVYSHVSDDMLEEASAKLGKRMFQVNPCYRPFATSVLSKPISIKVSDVRSRQVEAIA